MHRKKKVEVRNEDCVSGLKKVNPNCARLIFADPHTTFPARKIRP